MATLSVRAITENSAQIHIRGLSGGRLWVVCRTGRVGESGSYVYYNDDVYVGDSNTVTVSVSGLEPLTWYTANAAIDGEWIGAWEFETDAHELERPENWQWESAIVKGGKVRLTADEWNAFTLRINLFREYLGLEGVDFTEVQAGDAITAAVFEEARGAVMEMEGHGSLPGEVRSGDEMKAEYFVKLGRAMDGV